MLGFVPGPSSNGLGGTREIFARCLEPVVGGHLMAFVQLDPSLPMSVEGKGEGYAIAVIDYGPEHHLIWVVAINATGEIWSAPNPSVRMPSNWTMGRPKRQPDARLAAVAATA